MVMNLKGARSNAGFTQRQVIEELNQRGIKISKNTLVSYEKYKTKPDIAIATALANLYGCSVDDIRFF